MRGNRIFAFVMMLGALILSACGGGYPTPPAICTTNCPTGSNIASLTLLASSSQLPSASTATLNGVTITAIAKDASNGLVSGATVNFAASHGALSASSGITGDGTSGNPAGVVTNTLSASGDPANQSITVQASSGNIGASVQVQEIGTSVAITGPAVVGSGDTVTYTIKLEDSSGQGIQGQAISVTSSLNNPATPSANVTDANGQITVQYTGSSGGSDTLGVAVAALHATGSYSINVSGSKLIFESPTAGASVQFGASQTVKVLYQTNGSAVPNATINFTATRGDLTASSAVTDGSGEATVSISSAGVGGAGIALINAQASNGGPSASVQIDFLSTTPTSVDVQASPATVAPSGSSTVTAVVRDANNNFVEGQVVDFTITDTSGGQLSSATANTDSLGTATVQYLASSATSAKNGVVINAAVEGFPVSSIVPAYITVGGNALFITLGTSNKIAALDETRYQLPYSVFVIDSAGNAPPSGTPFRLSLRALSYQKGHFWWTGSAWVNAPQCTSSGGGASAGVGICGDIVLSSGVPTANTYDTPDGIGQTILSSDGYWDGNTVPPFGGPDIPAFGCISEDANANGILDSGEDYNGSKSLEPGSVATVPPTVALDATGSQQFQITYPKDHAYWVEVQLTGIATVAGTETTAKATFVLPGLTDDYGTVSVSPPGYNSPYGLATDCTDYR